MSLPPALLKRLAQRGIVEKNIITKDDGNIYNFIYF